MFSVKGASRSGTNVEGLDVKPGGSLVMSGACDGSGLPHYAASLLACKVHSLQGSECEAPAAMFLLKNFKMDHLSVSAWSCL